jgi:alkylation response protein AidB-like acyl-CoA dehydrogenase
MSIGQSTEAVALATQLASSFEVGALTRDRDRAFPHDELSQLKRSGLLSLLVPKDLDGMGASYGEMIRVVGALALGDPNVAQMAIVHFSGVELLNNVAPDTAKNILYPRITQDTQMFTNAYSEIGTNTIFEFNVALERADGGWSISGSKAYCTGSLGGELIYGLAIAHEPEPHPRVFVIGTDAPGVRVVDNWDGMGQRTTASGTIEFGGAFVSDDLCFTPDLLLHQPLLNFFGTNGQAMMSAIFVGIAKNALRDATDYVRTRSRAWPHAGVEKAVDDPYIIRTIGEMSTLIASAEATLDRAIGIIERAAADPTEEARAECSVAVAAAKTVSTHSALRVAELLFQACGAGATRQALGLDRHWRNVRTLTLHDPIEWKLHLSGNYLLSGTPPPISSHSP